MKKFLAIFLLNAFGFLLSSGQEVSIGIKPSIVVVNSTLIADLSNYPFMEVSPRISYGVGLTFSKKINKIGISAEPRFVAKGYNLEFGAGDIHFYRNNYLSLPVIFSYSPFRNLKFEIGPELSYLLSSKVNYSSESFWKNNLSKNLRSIELSLIPGISYTIFKRFDFGFRYGIGLTPYDKGQFVVNDFPFPATNYKFTHKCFEFYLSPKLFLKD